MNYSKLGGILGKIMILEGILMLAPLAVSFIYQESLVHKLAFFIPILLLAVIGGVLQVPKPKKYFVSKRRICTCCHRLDRYDIVWGNSVCDQ